eukprot:SAG11_NODE_11862_length_734_cov_1.302362_1_plen_132_part_01
MMRASCARWALGNGSSVLPRTLRQPRLLQAVSTHSRVRSTDRHQLSRTVRFTGTAGAVYTGEGTGSSGRWAPDSLASLAPFVPTPQIAVHKALELGRLQPTETFVDVGCGDGRLVLAAAPWCSQGRAIGIEL